jgi:hypothetical protein
MQRALVITSLKLRIIRALPIWLELSVPKFVSHVIGITMESLLAFGLDAVASFTE